MSRNALVIGVILIALVRVVVAQERAPVTGWPGRAQVWIIEDALATEAFTPKAERVRAMLAQAITNLTGKSGPTEAWLSLVSTQDVVGIKVYTQPGPNSGTRRAVAGAVAEALIDAGIPPGRIVIWDKHARDLRHARYFELADSLGIRVAASSDAGYDDSVFYESPILGNLIWGDLDFEKKTETVGRRSYVSKLLTREITRTINVSPLMNHNHAGVTGNLFSLALGSVDNTARFESHSDRLAIAVPEVYALAELSDRVALNIVDALVCQFEGEERSLLHYSVALNQLRLSRDPVALDVLSLDELKQQRERTRAPKVNQNAILYENASLLELGVSDRKHIQVLRLQ